MSELDQLSHQLASKSNRFVWNGGARVASLQSRCNDLWGIWRAIVPHPYVISNGHKLRPNKAATLNRTELFRYRLARSASHGQCRLLMAEMSVHSVIGSFIGTATCTSQVHRLWIYVSVIPQDLALHFDFVTFSRGMLLLMDIVPASSLCKHDLLLSFTQLFRFLRTVWKVSKPETSSSAARTRLPASTDASAKLQR